MSSILSREVSREALDLMINLVRNMYPEDDVKDVSSLCRLVNGEFDTDLTESQIREFLGYERFEKMMEFVEAEDEFLTREHCGL